LPRIVKEKAVLLSRKKSENGHRKITKSGVCKLAFIFRQKGSNSMKKTWLKYFSILLAVILFSGCGGQAGQEQAAEQNSGQEKTAKPSAAEQEADQQEKAKEKSSAAKNKGVTAPDFTLKDRDGNEVSLSSLQGKKVYLKFWASWCPPCRKSMPSLGELAAEERDFEIYTIVAPNFSGEKSIEDFNSWYDEQGYSKDIPVLFDETGEVMQAYQISAFPTNAFIGSDGVLVSLMAGATEKEFIKEKMESIQ
jgi:thioredoxin family protein